jgi:hypothetical protein
MTSKLWALTRMIDSGDPCWDESLTLIDTIEGLRDKFDLSRGVPYGWRLFKGKAALRFIKRMSREELEYQKQQSGIGRN